MPMRVAGTRRVAGSLAPGATGVDLTLTGTMIADIARGLTALEFPAAALGVRCTTDPDTGMGTSGPNVLTLSAGGFAWESINVGSLQTANNAGILATAALYESGVLTPAALAANTDDYAPAGYSSVSLLALSATTPVNLTGIVAVTNLTLWLLNTSANAITLKHDVTSTAANRFYGPGAADFVLTQYKLVRARYLASLSRWVLGGAG